MEERLVLATINKSKDEAIRITHLEYKEKEYFDIRLWVRPTGAGVEYVPTRKGLVMGTDIFRRFQEVVKNLKGVPHVDSARD